MPTKKNGGHPPIIKDTRMAWITAACGKCYECRKQKANAWKIRMLEEQKEHKICYFVTLTIDDKSYKGLKEKYDLKDDNDVATKAMRLWLERCRKQLKHSVKHWFITEKGHEGSKRVHLHGIIFDEKGAQMAKNHWNYGFVFIGYMVNQRTINYIVKYMLKPDTENDFEGKVLCSPALGKNYIKSHNATNNKYKGKRTDEMYRTPSGVKLRLPTYYRNQIYTEKEREALWKIRLNKGLVYVMGEEININNTKLYYESLDYYQKKSETVHKCAPPKWDQTTYNQRLSNQRENIKKYKYDC